MFRPPSMSIMDGRKAGFRVKASGESSGSQISNDLKETMLKICKGNLNVIIEWVWILFCYILFPDRKYRSGLAEFHPLIQGQPLYDQSSSPCKSFHLNGEYRCLQLLLPQNTFHRCIFACIYWEIKLKGDEPTHRLTGLWPKEGDKSNGNRP